MIKNDSRKTLKVIIAGGGTGGHIYTGVAIAEELRSRDNETEVLFVGTKKGLEKKLVPEEGFRIRFITVRGLKGKKLPETLRNFALLPIALIQSWIVIKKFKPQLVFGVGGYASGPVCYIAAKKKVPVVIVEQNSIPGIANRILSKYAGFAAIAYERAREYLKCRCEFTGVPLRAAFYRDDSTVKEKNEKEAKNERKTVLVLGGSQGAHGINKAMTGSIDAIAEFRDKVKIIHQTGYQDYEEVKAAYEKKQLDAEVHPFIKNIKSYYKNTSFAMSRSGAITTAELVYMGIPTVFVPLPKSIYNHQVYNAEELVDMGAALMIGEDEFTPLKLKETFTKLIDKGQIETMRKYLRRRAKVNSSRLVVDAAFKLLRSFNKEPADA